MSSFQTSLDELCRHFSFSKRPAPNLNDWEVAPTTLEVIEPQAGRRSKLCSGRQSVTSTLLVLASLRWCLVLGVSVVHLVRPGQRVRKVGLFGSGWNYRPPEAAFFAGR